MRRAVTLLVCVAAMVWTSSCEAQNLNLKEAYGFMKGQNFILKEKMNNADEWSLPNRADIAVVVFASRYDREKTEWKASLDPIDAKTAFHVESITAYRSAFDSGSYTVEIVALNDGLRFQILCEVPESYGGYMKAADFQTIAGYKFSR